MTWYIKITFISFLIIYKAKKPFAQQFNFALQESDLQMPYTFLMLLNSTIYWPKISDLISILVTVLLQRLQFLKIIPSAFASFIYKPHKI